MLGRNHISIPATTGGFLGVGSGLWKARVGGTENMLNKLYRGFLMLGLVLPIGIGCSGGGSSSKGDTNVTSETGDSSPLSDAGDTGAKSDAPTDGLETGATTLSISPVSTHVGYGGTSVALTATAGTSDTITWTLSPNVGTLSTTSGPSVTYTPPAATGATTSLQLIQITATVDGIVAQAAITLDPPVSDAGAPLGANGFVTVDRVVDFAIVGGQVEPTATSSTNDILVLQPGSVQGKTSSLITPTGTDRTLFDGASNLFASTQRKVAHSANLDADAPEETVVLSWTPDYYSATATSAGSAQNVATVNILDPSVDSTAKVTIALRNMNLVDSSGNPMTLDVDPNCGTANEPSWATNACVGNYDYDLALADIDGDGYNEVIITGTVANQTQWGAAATKPGMLWVFDDMVNSGSGQLKLLNKLVLNGVTANQGVMVARVAAGSMKADRSMQIAVAWFDAAHWIAGFDNTRHTTYNQDGMKQVSFAFYDAGTLKQIGGNQLSDGTTANNHTPLINNTMDPSGGYTNNLIAMTLADVDGDGLDELVLGGMNTYNDAGNTGWQAWVNLQVYDDLDAAAAAGGDLAAVPELANTSEEQGYNTIMNPNATGDWASIRINNSYFPWRWLVPISVFGTPSASTGTGSSAKTDQLIVGDNLVTYVAPTGATPDITKTILWNQVGSQMVQGPTPMSGVNISFQNTIYNLVTPLDYYGSDPTAANNVSDIQAGDVNGDGRDDVIIRYADGAVKVWGWLCQDNNAPCTNLAWTNFYSHAGSGVVPTTTSNGIPDYINEILVPTAVDGQSIVLQYAGEAKHSIIYKDNKILALLAAPPVLNGIGQDGETEYSTGTTFSSTVGATFSVSRGVVFGYEQAISVGVGVEEEAFKVSLEMELKLELSGAIEQTRSRTVTTTYTAGPGEDQVIFTTTPYDRYTYTVASSSNSLAVGTQVFVDVPQSANAVTLSVSRDYFNNVVNVGGLQITTDLLPDTPGNLSTYLTSSSVMTELPASVNVGLSEKLTSTLVTSSPEAAIPVDQGAGSTSREIDTSTDTGWSAAVTFSCDAKFEVVVAGITAGVTEGFSVGAEYSATSGSFLNFGATVGDIADTTTFQANQYQWGLLGYQQSLSDPTSGAVGQSFFVVNYWVQK
jgi:hypothetical protein